jgi:hypothetical protein
MAAQAVRGRSRAMLETRPQFLQTKTKRAAREGQPAICSALE